MALAEAQLGHWEKAQESLVKALDYRTDSKLSAIDGALQATLVRATHTRSSAGAFHSNRPDFTFDRNRNFSN